MSRKLSNRYSSFNDATYPEDLSVENLGNRELSGSASRRGLDPDSRNRMLSRNSSRAVDRGSGRFDSMSMRRSGFDNESAEDEDGESAEENENENEDEVEGEETGVGTEGGGGGEEPVRMSLMSLLAETDDGFMMGYGDDDEDDDDDGGSGGDTAGEYNNCCVCMVRHKGAAFVPCGHTFCRLCSRELWVDKGNCPLCNNFILEILDIF